LAQVLHEKHQLEPEAQQALADLMEELARSVGSSTGPSPETAQLASSVAEIARSLQEEEQPTLLAAARERLQDAALRAERRAPLVTGLARRLLEILADLGI
jgi:hypothetical protein